MQALRADGAVLNVEEGNKRPDGSRVPQEHAKQVDNCAKALQREMKGVAEKMLASGDALLNKVPAGCSLQAEQVKDLLRKDSKHPPTHLTQEADQESSGDMRHTGAGVSNVS